MSALEAPLPRGLACTREQSIWASRAVIVVVVGASLGSLALWQPTTWWQWALDITARAYLNFVAGAMAHEGTHGHLGHSRASNTWWGRLALLPTTVPYVTFRATHIAHHRYTNVEGQDPDAYLKMPSLWHLPFRAVAMPHHWLRWLHRTGHMTRELWLEYVYTYAGYFAVYGALMAWVGPTRFLLGLIPAAVLHSYLLWYPFAMKTHEGYSTGDAMTRSHNYRGALAFWLSCGLSLHRAHHLWPSLGWLQMRELIEPCSWREALTFRRDVRLHD